MLIFTELPLLAIEYNVMPREIQRSTNQRFSITDQSLITTCSEDSKPLGDIV
jgi:hypothetical protein